MHLDIYSISVQTTIIISGGSRILCLGANGTGIFVRRGLKED